MRLVEFPKLDVKLTNRLILGDGCKDGAVYALGEGVVKVYGRERDLSVSHLLSVRRKLLDKAKNEAFVARSLYNLGVSVPKPEGLVLADMSRYGRDYSDLISFRMERIDGVEPENLIGKAIRKRALELRQRELEKARDLGFSPFDVGDESTPLNFLYVPEREGSEEKVVLIDFVDWRSKNEN